SWVTRCSTRSSGTWPPEIIHSSPAPGGTCPTSPMRSSVPVSSGSLRSANACWPGKRTGSSSDNRPAGWEACWCGAPNRAGAGIGNGGGSWSSAANGTAPANPSAKESGLVAGEHARHGRPDRIEALDGQGPRVEHHALVLDAPDDRGRAKPELEREVGG